MNLPNSVDVLLDPVSLSILAMYALLMVYELAFPARKLPDIKGWRLKGVVFFFIYFYLSTYLPLLWAEFLPAAPLLNLSALGMWPGVIAGVLLYELLLYIWHRTMHGSDLLWKVFHQMHHSAERTDTYGAFYFSPWDMAGFTALSTISFSVLTGLAPQAITAIVLITTFFSIFQHANIKTPVWLGYIIQRPESHAYHHAKNIHRHNYSDLPLFDLLFGTFHNPGSYEHEAGFYEGGSRKVKEMLLFKDVSKK